jgi:hypothetical protein
LGGVVVHPVCKRLLLAACSVVLGASAAQAVVNGTRSGLEQYTVRLTGNGNCTGVVIASREIVTASHCARGMRVLAGGVVLRVRSVRRSASLNDGRVVRVSGDAVILQLDAPLPAGLSPAPIGAGSGDTYTIAGYGTSIEKQRGEFGVLREAQLVAAGARTLIDPLRSGELGASACFGDSGGPVFRGGELVGVITRASYPSRPIACGKFTHWARVSVGTARRSLARDIGR